MKLVDCFKQFMRSNEEEFNRFMKTVADDGDVVCLPTLTAFYGVWKRSEADPKSCFAY